jgi:predicted N-acetyltransferase YhbS
MNIRLEEPRDFSAVERLTREAFWTSQSRMSEHYVLPQFRSVRNLCVNWTP